MENPATWSPTVKLLNNIIYNHLQYPYSFSAIAEVLQTSVYNINIWIKEYNKNLADGVIGLSLPAFLEMKRKEEK